MEGRDAAISASVAKEPNRVLRQKCAKDEGKPHGDFVSADEEGDLNARNHFKVYKPLKKRRAFLVNSRHKSGARLKSGGWKEACDGSIDDHGL